MNVFGGVIVWISWAELRAKVLNFLLGQFEGSLGLVMFLLLTSQRFCALRTPRILPLFFWESSPAFIDARKMLVVFVLQFA